MKILKRWVAWNKVKPSKNLEVSWNIVFNTAAHINEVFTDELRIQNQRFQRKVWRLK